MRAFIFDMDGVIIDSEPIHRQVHGEIMNTLGINISKGELALYAGATNEYIFTKLKERYGIKKSVSELMDYKSKLIINKVKEESLEPINGIRELLNALRKNNIKIAIGSSSPRSLIEAVIDKFNLHSAFDCIVSGEEVERSKPYPDVYIEVSKNLGINPEKCIVVEDSHNGVQAAKSAGMKCIGFNNVNSGNQDLSKADVRVDTIRKIDIYNLCKYFE
ncbi:phosphatase [Clostridium botulinum]|uniref:HAD family hydrolase n=1 Tax=Clostridium botulinum TaxID=1491 RepID=UPI000174EBBF|nr:HAD family hydrolase [Clostridium botulinum]ACD51997.1 HAD-superfamily hydrolase, subfamily IA, variant 3 [Clostridium botulinum E3 str. Alaska E43]AJF29607.1 phosphatase [Clostridium botulinum]AJF32668.1 phosphatase [Clostridium botulinum]MBY6789173.1 HAD family hydrolase [Clostridium botulinum]MBY6816927.1 HAD family hydrolase [Clostridium botulinum]